MHSPPLPRPEPPALAQAATSIRASQEDLREYLTFLDDTNLSEAQKIELLQTLWSIMSAFVDLAFGMDPVQQAMPSLAARQLDEPDDLRSQADRTRVGPPAQTGLDGLTENPRP